MLLTWPILGRVVSVIFAFKQPPPPHTVPSVQHLLPGYCHLLLPGYPVIFLSQICDLPTADHTLYNKRKKKTDEVMVEKREVSGDLQQCFLQHLHRQHRKESEQWVVGEHNIALPLYQSIFPTLPIIRAVVQ